MGNGPWACWVTLGRAELFPRWTSGDRRALSLPGVKTPNHCIRLSRCRNSTLDPEAKGRDSSLSLSLAINSAGYSGQQSVTPLGKAFLQPQGRHPGWVGRAFQIRSRKASAAGIFKQGDIPFPGALGDGFPLSRVLGEAGSGPCWGETRADVLRPEGRPDLGIDMLAWRISGQTTGDCLSV